MKIAYCTDNDTFRKNKILDMSVAIKFPGTKWLPILSKLASQKNVHFVTGDIALARVQKESWEANEIIVLQDLDSTDGKDLIELGAVPFLLMGLESPLYAYSFYRNIQKTALCFENRILFSGIFKNFHSPLGVNFICHFPSFFENEILPIKKWSQKKFLALVNSNKYFELNLPVLPKYLTQHLDWLKDKLWIRQSSIRKLAISNELITKRLEAIEYFGHNNLLSIFGTDWEDLKTLPKNWQKRLKNILPKLAPKFCEDKIETISNYKFSICFENTAYPGYVTEKIIDCYMAGVIPIYLGAPDIGKFVPPDSFIDMRKYKSMRSLHNFIEKIPEQAALKMISEGRKFLHTEKGRLFSYDSFANFIFEMVLGMRPNSLRTVKKQNQKPQTII